MGITSLNIKNRLPVWRAKLTNILDFDSKKLSIINIKKNKTHVYYDNSPFYLVIDNLKGYFKKYDDNQYLTIISTSEDQKLMYMAILEKINKNINKNYTEIKFESNDVLPLNVLINIHFLVIAIRYQRVYLNTCWYNEISSNNI